MTSRRRRLVALSHGAAILPLLAAPRWTAAQAPCGAPSTVVERRWAAPLDRVVALHARDVDLREALARLGAVARLRFSYSAEALPLDRRVCMWRDQVSVGDALVALLAGVPVHPVVAAADYIVLAPGAATAELPGDAPTMARTTSVLDRVVVTGSADGASQRALSVAVDVVPGRALQAAGTSTLAAALDQAAPGMWLWTQSPTSFAANYASIRGASSFGVTYPKVYVDGIEIANPLLFTRFTPEMIERVEVIRGPQGAALYGADAISGVVNVVTRQDGARAGEARAELRSTAGLSQSEFAERGILAQEHALLVRGGSATRSGALAANVRTLGPFVPGSASEHFALDGTGRILGARTMLSGTLRFSADRAGAVNNPLLADVAPPSNGAPPTPWRAGRQLGIAEVGAYALNGGAHAPPDDDARRAPGLESALVTDSVGDQHLKQYTVGGRATFQQSARWTHVAVAGIDGYRLDGNASGGSIASAVDSALRAARGGADRATLRWSSVARFGDPERRAATLTLAAEHSTAREVSELPAYARGGVAGPLVRDADWWSTTGLVAQTALSWNDALFVTGGARLERTSGGSDAQVATLPMLGTSWVHAWGDATLKLRAAYGRGIRPPQTITREATFTGRLMAASRAELAPESQSGIEAGADLSLGRRLSLHVTRFDQRASGLIQPVTIVEDGVAVGGGAPHPRLAYELQNVGAIDNRGWELQGVTTWGALSVGGSLALVDSRVARLANGYRGDLRPGDRMLEVPARTLSLSATWTAPRWSTTWNASRANDWINYDGLALGESLASGTATPRDFAGSQLRAYWREYAGVTRLRGTIAFRLRGGTSLLFTGDNLLDYQRGEPDNVTVLPGRTIMAGLRADF